MLKITDNGLDYEINYGVDSVRDVLLRNIEYLQSEIDSLMLEYCPDEMTKEQKDNWAIHQIAVKL